LQKLKPFLWPKEYSGHNDPSRLLLVIVDTAGSAKVLFKGTVIIDFKYNTTASLWAAEEIQLANLSLLDKIDIADNHAYNINENPKTHTR
jgi:hypothetical protein